jgi:small subunit ribosomal protein S9
MAEESKKYIEAVGRRKTAIARVRLTEASKMSYTVNERELAHFFPTADLQRIVTEPFTKVKVPGKFKITAQVNGGGVSAQAESVRLGISRALLDFDKELRGKLKKEGFLKRDPRAKERRKFGLKKARKAPQWSKR